MYKSSCLLCGSPLVYQFEVQLRTCELCGRQFLSEVVCQQGHFVCEVCHSACANDLIEEVCLQSTSTAPIELAMGLMENLSVTMRGPMHHFLVPAVLLTAYYNQAGKPNEKERKLKTARQQAEHILGGFCGFYGACGVGIGTGIFISLILDTSALAGETWSLANQMTAESLHCISALGGPHCCKRDSFMAIKTARKFLKQNLQVDLQVPETIQCEFSELNRECVETHCPFYNPENA